MVNVDSGSGEASSLTQQMRLADAVIRRLDARARMQVLARDVLQGIRSLTSQEVDTKKFVGELSQGTTCSNVQKGQSITFNCMSAGTGGSFSCQEVGGNFNCNSTYNDNNKCATEYNCSTNFNCNNDAYDCQYFTCTGAQGAVSFNCNEKIDFNCTGAGANVGGQVIPAFSCTSDFECTAGHVFLCGDAHGCVDTFNCASKGMGPPNACTAPYPYNPPPPGNQTPGDFVCGFTGQNSPSGETFSCSTTFNCKAIDQFNCQPTTGFSCGKGATFNCSNNFYCGTAATGGSFSCSTQVNCGTYFKYNQS